MRSMKPPAAKGAHRYAQESVPAVRVRSLTDPDISMMWIAAAHANH